MLTKSSPPVAWVTWGKVVGSGPPWPVRTSGNTAADILADWAVGTVPVDGDPVIVWRIAEGQYAVQKMVRS